MSDANELADRLEARAEYWEGRCNRLNYGACQTRACLVRGGWKRGDPVDYDLATCETRESCNTDLAAASTLRANAERIKALEEALDAHGAEIVSLYDRLAGINDEIEVGDDGYARFASLNDRDLFREIVRELEPRGLFQRGDK